MSQISMVGPVKDLDMHVVAIEYGLICSIRGNAIVDMVIADYVSNAISEFINKYLHGTV
jgi:hypothetical protein